MEGQLSVFDILKTADKHCKNCTRFNGNIEQPPVGWGKLGWCHCYNYKVSDRSYCNEWEVRR